MKSIFNYCKTHKIEVAIIVIAVILLPWVIASLVLSTGWSLLFDPDSIDHAGSFIGGVSAFIGIYYLYKTLRSQNDSFQIQNFETKYIELIKFNRDLVVSMKSVDVYSEDTPQLLGKDVFDLFNKQMEEAIGIVSEIIDKMELLDLYNKDEECKGDKLIWGEDYLKERTILNISYLIVFFGVKANGCSLLEKKYLIKYKSDIISGILRDCRLKLAANSDIKNDGTPIDIAKVLKSENKLFTGFQNELGSYFRTLYQCVRYVNKQSVVGYVDKYDYVKMLRGQMSNMEEVVLFYNSLSDIGIAWEYEYVQDNEIDNMLITKYNLIKNIPENLTKVLASNYYPKVYYEYMVTAPSRTKLYK